MYKRGSWRAVALLALFFVWVFALATLHAYGPSGLQTLNQPPYQISSEVLVNGTTSSLQLLDYFGDPEGDVLSFTSDDPAILTQGYTLTFTAPPETGQEYTATITVSDGTNTIAKPITFTSITSFSHTPTETITSETAVSEEKTAPEPEQPLRGTLEQQTESTAPQTAAQDTPSVSGGKTISVVCTDCGDCTTCLGTDGNTCTLSGAISAAGTCITSMVSNTILDCLGFTLTYNTGAGTGNFGITVGSAENITIRNCDVVDGTTGGSNLVGLILSGTRNATVHDNIFRANGTQRNRGVELSGTTFVKLQNNNIYAEGSTGGNAALNITGGEANATIAGNVLYAEGTGGTNFGLQLNVVGPLLFSNNTIEMGSIRASGDMRHVTLNQNALNGSIALFGILGSTIINNSIENNTITGTLSLGASGTVSNNVSENRIFQNNINANLSTGISLTATNSTYIISNTVTGGTGISLSTSSRNVTLDANTITLIGTGNGINIRRTSLNFPYTPSVAIGHNISTTNTINGSAVFYYGGAGASPACPGGTLTSPAASHITFVQCDGVTLEDFAPIDPITIINSTNIRMQRLTLTKGLDSNGTGITLHNSTITRTSTSSNDGSLTDGSNYFIENNTFSFTDTNYVIGFAGFGVDYSIRNNTFVVRGGVQPTGILIDGQRFTVINNSVDVFATTGGSAFGLDWDASHSTVENNTIIANGSGGCCMEAITVSTVNNINVSVRNNRIVADDDGTGTCCNYAINGAGHSWTIESNNVSVNGSDCCNEGFIIDGSNVIVNNNALSVEGANCCHYGLDFSSGVRNNQSVTNNILSVFGFGADSDNFGIYFGTVDTANITNNQVRVTGTGGSHGAISLDAGIRVTAQNNTLFVNGTGSRGIWLTSTSNNNLFIGNNVSTADGATYALSIEAAQTNNSFVNTTLNNTQYWINTLAGSTTQFNNTWFLGPNSSVNITSFTLSGATTLGRNNINLFENRTFVNTANVSALNSSGIITLLNAPFTEPRPRVDYNDDNIFAVCRAPTCTIINDSNQTFTFSVSHFTSHSAAQRTSADDCPFLINGTYTLTQNVTCPETGILIQASNLVLDCAGFTVEYGTDGLFDSHGIFAENRQNITIQNCNIAAGSALGSQRFGILLRSTDSSNITNNTIQTNGEYNSVGIALNPSANNNYVANNFIVTTGNGSDNIGIDLFTAAQNNTVASNTVETNGTSTNVGIRLFSNSNNNSVINNTIQTNGSDNNHGIQLLSSLNNTIQNNTVRTAGSGVALSNNSGIRVDSSNTTLVHGNSVSTDGTGRNIGIRVFSSRQNTVSSNIVRPFATDLDAQGIYVSSDSDENLITQNDIATNGTGSWNWGLIIDSDSDDNNATFNTIITNGTNNNHGLKVEFSAYRNNIRNNNITARGTGTNNFGIVNSWTSDNNTFENNIVHSEGTTSHGIRVSSFTNNSQWNNNTISTSGTNSFGINIGTTPGGGGSGGGGADRNFFTDTRIVNVSQWISVIGSNTTNFTNTTFENLNGSINIPLNFSLAGTLNVTKNELNISLNNSYLNSTNITAMNTSAIITLRDLSFTNPQPLVDFEDDGTFAVCAIGSQCDEIAYDGENYTFNVSSFTSYAASETSAGNTPPSITQVILNSTDGSGAALNTSSPEENLTVVIVNATDADADPVQNITDWRINGTSITLLNLPFETNSSNTAIGGLRDYRTSNRTVTLGDNVSGQEPAWTTLGQVGGAYQFDGLDDTITADLDGPSDPYTLSAWVRYTGGAFDAFNVIMEFGDDSPFFGLDAGQLTLFGAVTDPSALALNQWHLVTYTFNGTQSVLYVNGTVVDNQTATPASGGTELGIGYHGTDDPWEGLIDEAIIFNRSLSQAQINALYQDGTARRHMTTLASPELALTDSWTVAVTPNDQQPNTDGTTVVSNNVTIQEDLGDPCPGTVSLDLTLTNNIDGTTLGGGNCIDTATPNIVIDCAGFTLLGDNTSTAVYVSSADNVTVENCIIVDWATGISYELSNDGIAQNNTIINTPASLTLLEGNRTLVQHNTVNSTNGGMSVTGNTFAPTINHTLYNNTIDASGGSCILLAGYTDVVTAIVQDNTVFHCNDALSIGAASEARVENFTAYNSSTISVSNAAQATLTNIFMHGRGTFQSDSSITTVTNLYIANATGGLNLQNSSGFPASGSETIQLTNVTVLSETPQWMTSSGFEGTDSTITNFTFGNHNGSVTWAGTYALPNSATVGNPGTGELGFNITQNLTQLNSTALSFLNTSARVSLLGLSLLNPSIVVDFEDDGTFASCPPPQCENLTSTFGNITFDVLSFTGYAASGTSAITACQNINTPGEYNLGTDLATGGTCFNITASNVTLNCNGFTLTGTNGSDTFGVNVTNSTNVTVRDCTFRHFESGLLFNNANNSIALNNSALENLDAGLFLFASSNSTFQNNTAQNNQNHGIAVAVSTNNILAGNNALNNQFNNFRITGSTNNTFLANYLNGLDSTGLGFSLAFAAQNNTLISNTITNHTRGVSIIETTSDTGNTITSNLIENHSDTGISSFANQTHASNNTIRSNAQGISIGGAGGFNSTVTGNTIENNTGTGIGIGTTSAGTIITDNIVRGNTDSGLSLGFSTTHAAHRNTFTQNLNGIEITGNGDNGTYTDNTFVNNTNAAIIISSSGNNTFTGTNITINTATSARWLESGTTLANNQFERTLFNTTNGSILIIPSVTLPSQTNISTSNLNITSNLSTLNSTNISFLNTTAQITLRGLNFTDAQAYADFEDDGTFAVCNPPQCTEISYAGGTFVFNVSSFTSYAASEATVSGACTTSPNITSCCNITSPGAYHIAGDIIENGIGTCITFHSGDATLDCLGSTIEADNPIATNLVSNIATRNCIINATASDGIAISTSNDENITFDNLTIIIGSGRAITVDPNLSDTVSRDLRITNTYIEQSSASPGIAIDYIENALLENNTVFGGGFSGALQMTGTNNITIRNNSLWDWASGASLSLTANNSLVINNSMTSNLQRPLVIFGNNNTFINNILETNNTWILTDITAENNTFTNTTFLNRSSGSVRIDNFTMPADTSWMDVTFLDVHDNRSHVNTNNLTFANSSGIITLFNTTFTDPQPLIDIEDDGTYLPCSAPECEELSHIGDIFVFNTSHFTSHAASETPLVSNCTQVINSSTTLLSGISCPETAVLIAQDNVTLDCAGNTIEFDTAGGGFDSGIIAFGRNNITLANCIISDPTENGSNSFGINLTGTVLSTVQNNTVVSNASSNSSGIFIHQSSENNTIENNTVTMNGQGGNLSSLHFFTEPRSPMILRTLDAGRTNIQPHLAIDSDNNVHVVAACRTAEIFTGFVCYEKLDNEGRVLFNDSFFLTNDEEPIRTPFLAITGNDTLFVVFTGNDVGGGDPNQVETIMAKFLKNGTILEGDSFAINITPDEIARSINMRIVPDSQGKLQAVWSDEGTTGGGSDQFRLRYTRFNDSYTSIGGPFSSFQNLSTVREIIESETNDSQTDRLGFDIAVDRLDNVHLVFRNEDRDRILYMLINGTSPTSQVLIAPTIITNTTLAFSNFPQIVVDDDLVASVTIHDESIGIESYITQLDPYNESLDGSNSSLATIVRRNMVPLSINDGQRSVTPAIDIDRLGNLHIVWKEESVGANGGIVYTLLDRDLNVLVPQTTLSNSTSNVFGPGSPPVKPFIKIDRTQRAHVVWHDFAGTDSVYYANIPSGSSRNFVHNNVLNGNGHALLVQNANNNTFTNLHLRTINTSNFAILVNDSTNTSIQHATLNNTYGWLNITNSTTNITNTTFATDNGSIRYNGSLLLNETTITQQQLNTTLNLSFANSTSIPSLNTTAQITLNGIGFTAPQPLVDFEDDGTFAICSAPQCIQQSYAGGVLVFDVLSFTSYASAESIANASAGIINLTFDKTDTPDPSPRGSSLSYQIQINNTGNATAENVTVEELYPSDVSFASSSPAPDLGNNTWNLGNLSNGSTTTINITVTIGSTLANGTVLNNTFIVNFTNSSGSITTGNDSELTTVLGAPVLVSIKSDSPDPVIRGQQLNYSILINNTGDDTAFNVSLTENYPGGVSFVSAQPTPLGNGTFSIGTLAPNESFVVNVTVTVGANVANGTILNNSVNASWRNVSGEQGGVSDSELTTVLGIASITVTKTDSPDPVTNGSVLSYQITVTNTGDEVAYNVTAVDGYPANVSLGTTSPAPAVGNNTFSLGNLTPGASTTLNITVTVDGNMTAGIVNNTVNVTFENATGETDQFNAFQATTVTTPAVPAAPSGGGGGGSNLFRTANITRNAPQILQPVSWPTVAPQAAPAPQQTTEKTIQEETVQEPLLAPANTETQPAETTSPGPVVSEQKRTTATALGTLLFLLALIAVLILARKKQQNPAGLQSKTPKIPRFERVRVHPPTSHRADLKKIDQDIERINKLIRDADRKLKR